MTFNQVQFAHEHTSSRQSQGLSSRGSIREDATDSLAALSFSQRRELRGILRECNKRDSLHISSLCEAISERAVREPVLRTLCAREYLLWRPSQRGRLLEALLPFAHEAPVQAFAMLSLREPAYARSYAICAPSARILKASISAPPDPITDELLDLAKRHGRETRGAASKIAFMLLKDAPLTDRSVRVITHQARVWYAERQPKGNPWLALLIHHRHENGLALTSDILSGNMRDPHAHPVLFGILSLPFLPHEIALVSPVVALVAREVCRALGQNNRVANSTAVILTAGLIIGSRMLFHAARLDRLNRDRDHERGEAISHLSTLLTERPFEPTREESRFFGTIERLLRDSARGLFQSKGVREAARAALHGVSNLEDLRRVAHRADSGDELIDRLMPHAI